MSPIIYSQFQTGDILLCHYGNKQISWLDWVFGKFTSLITIFTSSPYSHVAVILRDPTFVDIPNGIYVWESSYDPGIPDPQDGLSNKIGVRITPIDNFLKIYKDNNGKVIHRQVTGSKVNQCFSNENFKKIHDVVYNRPYDLEVKDWIAALHPSQPYPCTTERFWCSALVGYIYKECGVLSEDTQWTTMRPCDFDITSDTLNYTCPETAKLSDSLTIV